MKQTDDNSITLHDVDSKIDKVLDAVNNQEQILDIEGAASYLKLAKGTIYNLTSRHEIPFHRPAGRRRIYFKKSELDEWILTSASNL